MLINFFGLPGTGKSTIRNAIISEMHPLVLGKIVGDHYLRSKPQSISFPEFFSSDNFDWKLLEQQLTQANGTILPIPDYDFSNFKRISISGTKSWVKQNINVIDTVWPCPFADIKVLLVLDEFIRIKRISTRVRDDLIWKKYYLKQGQLRTPTTYDQNWKNEANLLLNAEKSLSTNTEVLMRFLKPFLK